MTLVFEYVHILELLSRKKLIYLVFFLIYFHMSPFRSTLFHHSSIERVALNIMVRKYKTLTFRHKFRF